MNEQELINPILIVRYDNCPYCKRNTIELFDTNHYALHYSNAVLEYMKDGKKDQFNKYAAYNMRCRSCGKEFLIQWVDGFPIPFHSENKNYMLNLFVGAFEEEYKQTKNGNSVTKDYLKDIL